MRHALLLPLALLALAAAQPHPCQPGLEAIPETTRLTENLRRDLFDHVYDTVRDAHPDSEYGGFDWRAVRGDYRPRVLAATTDQEVYRLLTEMVARLGDPYTRFTSADALRAEPRQPETPQRFGGIGSLTVFLPGNALGVLWVYPDSPAERAGLRPRDRILAVDGDPCPHPLKIRGPAGSALTLTVRSPGAAPREVTLTRAVIEAGPPRYAWRLPDRPDVLFARPGSLGLAELGEAQAQLGALLEEGEASALILDLRGTSAEHLQPVVDFAGALGNPDFGTLAFRHHTERLAPSGIAEVNGRLAALPLTVLIDSETQPGAAMLAANLQASGRARLVGRAVPGPLHAYWVRDLFDGSRLMVAWGVYTLPDGARRESLTPDMPVDADPWDYPEASDPDVAAALALLAP
jgi:carboxyl-terminal processing protease